LRFWFDVLTPKQLLFFNPVMEELKSRGHEVLATSRHYREVEQLATLLGVELKFVGARGGKGPYDQLRASLERMNSLLPVVGAFQPDSSVSVASADAARISFGIRVRHVAVSDSPHSVIAGKLSLPFSSHLLTPWIIPYIAWYRFGVQRSEITKYRALDPAAWLKRKALPKPPQMPLKAGKPTILVRLEESYAPYMIGTDEAWTSKVLQRLSDDFGDCNLIALCRYPDQLEMVKQKFGSTYVVPEKVVDGAGLIRQSDVFIGMGGTMTTEAALIGVPTISAYQGSGLYTERYLLSMGLLLKTHNLDKLSGLVRKSLTKKYHDHCRNKAKRLLDSMEDPVERIVSYLTTVR
jgi:predicted glycosyltransferase